MKSQKIRSKEIIIKVFKKDRLHKKHQKADLFWISRICNSMEHCLQNLKKVEHRHFQTCRFWETAVKFVASNFRILFLYLRKFAHYNPCLAKW